MVTGKYPTITMLAEACGQYPCKLTKILNLVNLSPAIQEIIVEGNAPPAVNLNRLYTQIPVSWEEQENVFALQA